MTTPVPEPTLGEAAYRVLLASEATELEEVEHGKVRCVIVTPERVVNILEVPALRQIERLADGSVKSGAIVRLDDLLESPYLRPYAAVLDAIRGKGEAVPFLIFASGDSPEYRREAAAHGAQLSTNDMLELIQTVVERLGE